MLVYETAGPEREVPYLASEGKVTVQFTPAGIACVGLGSIRRTPNVSLAASNTLSITDTVAACTLPAGWLGRISPFTPTLMTGKAAIGRWTSTSNGSIWAIFRIFDCS